MKKHFWTYMSIYCGIAVHFLLAMMLVTSVILFSIDKVLLVSIFLFAVPGCALLVYIYVKNFRFFWAYGVFEEQQVRVKCIFCKEYCMQYEKCNDVGVGYYFHGALNGPIGSKVKYIYFSYKWISSEDRKRMNALHISPTFIKMAYSQKTYKALLQILPNKQAIMLKKSVDDADFIKEKDK